MATTRQLGLTTSAGPWVQVDRKALEKWAQLTLSKPRAAAVLQLLLANMGRHNAVIISQSTMARLLGINLRTVQRAVETLKDQNWIEVRQIGQTGTTNAYIVNDRVAWSGKRDGIRYSLFSAAVVVSEDEQPDKGRIDDLDPLENVPTMYPGEQQLPTGDGLEPPSEPAIPGLEHDLPARQPEHHQTDLEDFTGKPVMIDRETGEIIDE